MHPGRKTLFLIFLAALALRLPFALTRGEGLDYYDSRAYSQIAQNWLAGQGWHDDVGRRASRAPGYPVFLAGCYSIGVERPKAIYAIQAVADALMCVLLALLGRRLFNARVGWLAGWTAVFYPFFIYFTGLLLAETLFTLGLVALVLLLTGVITARARAGKVPERDGARPGAEYRAGSSAPLDSSRHAIFLAIAAGGVAGILIHLRSSFLLFPLFILPIFLMRAEGRLRALAAWTAMAAAAVVVLLPWIVRNERTLHHFIPTTLQVGESLYEANHPGADGGPAMEKIDWLKLRGRLMDEYDHNAFFKDLAVRHIRENPGQFLVLAGRKFCRFWNPLMNNEGYRGSLYSAVSTAVWLPIMILAMVGAVVLRRRGEVLLLLAAPVAYYTVLHMVFVGSVRYRTPIMPFVIILAAVGADAFWARWMARHSKEESSAGG